MRKFIVIAMIAAVMLTASAAAIFAQDTGTTTTASAAWLGVGVVDNNSQVVVGRVQPGSPADTANVQVGDVIISFNGTAIASVNDLRQAVQAAAAGDTVTLNVTRNGQAMDISVTLGSAPARFQDNQRTADVLDALFMAERLVHAGLQSVTGGYQVLQVVSELNPFALQIGDVVNTLNGQDITQLDLRSLRDSLTSANGALTLEVTRGGESVTLTGTLADGYGDRGGFSGRGGIGGPDGRGGRGDLNQPGQPGNQANPPQYGNPQNANPPANGGGSI